MTATAAEIPHEVMVHITDRITHEVAGINRVLYDFTPKPTGTVEFEQDILFLGKRYCCVHDWSQKRKSPVLSHWGFSIPFLEQEA